MEIGDSCQKLFAINTNRYYSRIKNNNGEIDEYIKIKNKSIHSTKLFHNIS